MLPPDFAFNSDISGIHVIHTPGIHTRVHISSYIPTEGEGDSLFRRGISYSGIIYPGGGGGGENF